MRWFTAGKMENPFSPERGCPTRCPLSQARGCAIAIAASMVTSCGRDATTVDPPPPEPPRPVAISVSPASFSFASIGDTASFTARVTDQTGAEFSATVTWTSENPEVFTVAPSGLVTAVGNGTGTVRASFQELTATAQVTVRQVVAAVACLTGARHTVHSR